MSNRLISNLTVDRFQSFNNNNSNKSKFNGIWYYTDIDSIQDNLNMPFIKITIENGYYFAQFYSDINFTDIVGVHDRPVYKKPINIINDYEINFSFVPDNDDPSQNYIIPSLKFGKHKFRRTTILFSKDYEFAYLIRSYHGIEATEIEKNKINQSLGSFVGKSNDFNLKTIILKKNFKN